MFKTIKSKIITILQTLEGTALPLKEVFGYIEPSPQQYPCAMIRWTGNANETRLDSANNELTIEFTVRVLMPADNTETSEDQRLDLVDSIMAAFRSATNVDTLNGTVERFDVSALPIETNEDMPVFGFDLVINASKIMLI